MFYVYILQSVDNPDSFYTGFTNDLRRRMEEHNSGSSIHTNKFKPWRIKNYFAFDNEEKARHFESYLKSQVGRAFSKKHF
jgi:predicted GIY-YIG superfamily endonuclease